MNTLALRAAVNRWRRRLLRPLLFRVLFGERSQGRDLPHTRIAPSTCIEHEDGLRLGDHVFIGHFNLIEASGGVTIGDGVQITSHCAIVTHSSHRSLRLLGPAFATWAGPGPRPGWIAGPVEIGPWSYIGPHCVIEAGTRLGRGTIVKAGTRVRGTFPDFAILEGSPAKVVGDSRDGDETLLQRHPQCREQHAAWAASPAPGAADDNEPR
ncbi:acyltransferase [Sphaerotilus uruguayifluvii]|uniref:Acetyltransferase-like isoleucine patch superfamily enzyme n=1 Tax=Sphaerotilus uruguayifluvii TaxID=2735897 RepID=A0ABX2G9S3_9BURK|nr:acyltransferase [Leptothrix sp. C29]NRT58175.1 acetyltransferase-like isoleucine patch superfamily enzyme [Leptothrix sp. C29]